MAEISGCDGLHFTGDDVLGNFGKLTGLHELTVNMEVLPGCMRNHNPCSFEDELEDESEDEE
jgi:hypothetical protein